MRIQVLLGLADAARSYEAGEVCEVADDQAHRWIAAGWAIETQAAVGGPEAAAVAPAPENAKLPAAEKRPRNAG